MNNSLRWFQGFFFFYISLCVSAQLESFLCKCCNPDLKDLFKGGILKSLYIHSFEGPGLDNFSSSFLLPAGTPPEIIRTVVIRTPQRDATQDGTVNKDLTLIEEEPESLTDKNGYQNLPVPKFIVESYLPKDFDQKVEYQYSIGIEILEVYPGSKYEDTTSPK